jgi:alginate O-acetyltransferase complex protein AlgI
MLFNSIEFIFYFLPTVVVIFYISPPEYRPLLLLCASLVFYSWWNPRLTPLLLASIGANYLVGLKVVDALTAGNSRLAARFAIAGVAVNLTILGYFKYRYFVADLSGVSIAGDPSRLVIPLAISFYTFQQISFLVDAWRGEVGRIPFIRYAAFVTFFPHLIAGPIFRHNELIPQFARDERPNALSNIVVGTSIFALGLLKKVWIADTLAASATPIFDLVKAGQEISSFDAWSALFAYHFQIYFDFSGYSTMAIGIGKMFGIDLPLNFRSPYRADSIIEFWRRWHITLSRFLRDYLYIPLGGNRYGAARRYLNLIITMALGGLWHGAAWGFVIWGLLHGLYLAINHAWRKIAGEAMPYWLGGTLTFFAVAIAWVPFRAESLDATRHFFAAMMDSCEGCAHVNAAPEVFPLLLIALAISMLMPTVEQFMGIDTVAKPAPWVRWFPSPAWAVAIGIVFFVSLAAIMAVGQSSEFLYFRF